LIEHGIVPEMVVGTSAGSLNAIHVASDPSPEGMARLAEHWREAGSIPIGWPKLLTAVRRLIAREPSLISHRVLAEFLDRTFPQGVVTFGQLRGLHNIRSYAVAVCMETGETVAFGDRPEDRLIDGAMSSTAIPPFFGPWRVDGRRYLDGGVNTKLPLDVAVQRGADQILALDIVDAMGALERAKDMTSISSYALSLMVERLTRREIEQVRDSGVGLKVITLQPPPEVAFWDYGHADLLIELGRAQAENALVQQAFVRDPRLLIRARRALAGAFRGIMQSLRFRRDRG
jgi:NTE family protein